MSSKLAQLLKCKAPATANGVQNADEPPTKRQRKLAASKPGDTPLQVAAAAAAAASQQQHTPSGQRRPAETATKRASLSSVVEDDEVELPAANAAAYSELVNLLSSRRNALGAALKQRQLQEQGGVSEDDETDDDDEGSEEPSDSESETVSTGSEQDGAAAANAADSDAEADETQQKQYQNGKDSLHQQQNEQQQPDNQKGEPPAAAASSSSTPATTNWETFMSRELSESEVTALQSGQHHWIELPPEQDPSEGLWKRAKWQLSGRSAMPPSPSTLAAYGVKERLIARWHDVHHADAERLASNSAASTSSGSTINTPQIKPGTNDFTSGQQRLLFALCDSYADVFYAAKPYPGGPTWSASVPDESMDAVLLHVLNHCAKTADVIKKNNDKLKAQQGQGDVADAVPRDQGFTRPKALILLPMRNMAFDVVRRLVALAQKETRADSVQGKEKFLEQFIGDDDDDEQQQQEDGEGTAAAGGKRKGAQKPSEHRALFRGNLDDHFRLGIRITRGQIKLFADFMQSDIIIASPMGLATKLAEDAAAAAAAAAERGGRGPKGKGHKGAAAAAGGAAAAGPGGEADFLSSIEVCVVERADVMLMQNWQHVVTVLEALNQLPKQQHGTDIMRVRLHLLASQGRLYRQTIMSSSFTTPQLNALFGSLCCSHAGKVRLMAQPTGVLSQVVPQVRQLFERFPVASAAAVPDARFEFFKASIWPRISEAGGGGVLLVVPSYFDYVRIRNFMKQEEADYGILSEYCTFSAVTKARAVFFQRRVKVLLYTERAHFYHRYRIRGIQDIVFYGLPDHAHFYSELVNLVQTGGAAAAGHHATISTMFCQYDALALSRVVGQSRAAKMLAAENTPTFVFC